MATGFTSSATTVTTVADLYKKQNTDVKIAIKLMTEEASWFREYPRENIVVSGNENRIPLVLTQPLYAGEDVGKGTLPQRAFDAVTEMVIALFRAGAERL